MWTFKSVGATTGFGTSPPSPPAWRSILVIFFLFLSFFRTYESDLSYYKQLLFCLFKYWWKKNAKVEKCKFHTKILLLIIYGEFFIYTEQKAFHLFTVVICTCVVTFDTIEKIKVHIMHTGHSMSSHMAFSLTPQIWSAIFFRFFTDEEAHLNYKIKKLQIALKIINS